RVASVLRFRSSLRSVGQTRANFGIGTLVYRFQQFVAKGIELHEWVASRMGIKWWLGRAHIGPPASTVWRRHLAPPLRQLAADQPLEPAAPLGRERRDLPVEQRAGLCDCTQVDRTEVIALEKMQ